MGLLGEGGDLYAFFNTLQLIKHIVRYPIRQTLRQVTCQLCFLLTTILTLASTRLLKCIKIKDQLTVLQVSIVQTYLYLENRMQQSSIMASEKKIITSSRGEKVVLRKIIVQTCTRNLHHKIARSSKNSLDEKFKRSHKQKTRVHISSYFHHQ